jgi:signal recognition particle subunit SRP19
MSLREYIGEKIVIWPHNIDCTVSRRKGRKLGLKECVSKPKIDEIVKVAENLGLSPIQEDKSHPKRWFMERGRIVVLKKANKLTILKNIASEVKKLRAKTGG